MSGAPGAFCVLLYGILAGHHFLFSKKFLCLPRFYMLSKIVYAKQVLMLTGFMRLGPVSVFLLWSWVVEYSRCSHTSSNTHGYNTIRSENIKNNNWLKLLVEHSINVFKNLWWHVKLTAVFHKVKKMLLWKQYINRLLKMSFCAFKRTHIIGIECVACCPSQNARFVLPANAMQNLMSQIHNK